jgi:hypothetical protein
MKLEARIPFTVRHTAKQAYFECHNILQHTTLLQTLKSC